jgi:hypothetical protein
MKGSGIANQAQNCLPADLAGLKGDPVYLFATPKAVLHANDAGLPIQGSFAYIVSADSDNSLL